MAQQPLVGQGLLNIEGSRSQTQPNRYDTSGRVISPSRDPYLTIHNTQLTHIHAPCGIRTQNPSKRATADPRLTLHGQWDRQPMQIYASDYCQVEGQTSHSNYERLTFQTKYFICGDVSAEVNETVPQCEQQRTLK